MKEGWIEKRTGKRGVTFRVRSWAPNALGELAPTSASFAEWAYPSRREAEAAAKAELARVLTEVRAGDYLAPTKTTLGELVRAWIDGRDAIAANTGRNYRIAIKHLRPETAAIPIQQLKAHHLQRLYAALRADGIGAGIMRQLHVVLNAALAQAVDWELIRRNPAAQVEAPAVKPPPLRYWTPEQSAAFLDAEGGDGALGTLWHLLVQTGMRCGEARALRWGDIDAERRTITITRTVTKDAKGSERIGATTKTANSRRTIPLPASCLEPLRRHRVRQRERRVAASSWSLADGDLVFTNPTGSLLGYHTAQKGFAAAVARNGLPPLTMHGLRHGFATDMLVAGVNPKTVAELIGDTVATVLRVYSHVTVAAREDAVEQRDARIARLRAPRERADGTTT